MHQTELSGFRVFRPTTQELLFRPGRDRSTTPTASPHTKQQSLRPTSLLPSTALPRSILKASTHKGHTRELTLIDGNSNSLASTAAKSKLKRNVHSTHQRSWSRRNEKVLPELLFPQSPVKETSSCTNLKTQTPSKINLPAIVSS